MSEDQDRSSGGPRRRDILKKLGAASFTAGVGIPTLSGNGAAAQNTHDYWADAQVKEEEAAVADGETIIRAEQGDELAASMEDETDLQREIDYTLAWDLKPKDDDLEQYNPSLVFLPFAPAASNRAEKAAEVGPAHAGGLIAMVADVDGERVPTAGFGITRTPVQTKAGNNSEVNQSVARERIFSPKDGVSVEVDRQTSAESLPTQSDVGTQVGECAFCTALVSTACVFLSTVDDAACIYYCYSLSAVPPAALGCAGICAALIASSGGQVLVCSAGSALSICVGAGFC